MKKNIIFNGCKSYEDIEAIVLSTLKYDEVVDDETVARQWFNGAGIDGDITSREVVNANVSIWNEEMNGEELYNVRIFEYYVDSGSSDYVYSYDIKEM